MKNVRFIENDKIEYKPLKDVLDYLRQMLEINGTVYGYLPTGITEVSVRYNGNGNREISIAARGKLFELDVENKTYSLTERI